MSSVLLLLQKYDFKWVVVSVSEFNKHLLSAWDSVTLWVELGVENEDQRQGSHIAFGRMGFWTEFPIVEGYAVPSELPADSPPKQCQTLSKMLFN